MKKIIEEFKIFIKRGNAIELAIGLIIGSAFTAIVTSLTDGIFKPFINWIISLIVGSDKALESIYTVLKPVYSTIDGSLDLTKSIYINWGSLIGAIINFLIVSIILFVFIKGLNKAKDAANFYSNLANIAILKEKNGLKLTTKEAKAKELYLIEMEKEKQLQEEKKRLEELEKNKLSKTEELLTEIKDILQNK